MNETLKNRLEKLGLAAVALLAGFSIGFTGKAEEPKIEKIVSDAPIVNFQKIEGQDLFFTLHGGAVAKWGDSTIKSGNGEHKLSITQLPTEAYLSRKKAQYLANLKTKKFYPTDSYPARCVEPRYSRLYQTKEAAISDGFRPSKLVK